MSHRLMQKPSEPHPELDRLLKESIAHEMSPKEKFEQAVSFVYGQLPEDNPTTKDEVREHLMGSPLGVAADYRAWRNRNTYDSKDRVQRESVIQAGALKIASYRVRDPETGEYGKLQFHMTFDNTVMALMSEEAAKLFVGFVKDHFPEVAGLRESKPA